MHYQTACMKLLLKNGADPRKLNEEKIDYLRSLSDHDAELKKLLS